MQRSCTPQAKTTPLKRRLDEDNLLSFKSTQRSCAANLMWSPTPFKKHLSEDWRSPVAEDQSRPTQLEKMLSAVASPMRNRVPTSRMLDKAVSAVASPTDHQTSQHPHKKLVFTDSVAALMTDVPNPVSSEAEVSTMGDRMSQHSQNKLVLTDRVATLMTDVPVPLSSEDESNENTMDMSSDASEELEILGIRRRLRGLSDSDATEVLSDPEGIHNACTIGATPPNSRLNESLNSSERVSDLSETPTEQRDSDVSSDAEGELESSSPVPAAELTDKAHADGQLPENVQTGASTMPLANDAMMRNQHNLPVIKEGLASRVGAGRRSYMLQEGLASSVGIAGHCKGRVGGVQADPNYCSLAPLQDQKRADSAQEVARAHAALDSLIALNKTKRSPNEASSGKSNTEGNLRVNDVITIDDSDGTESDATHVTDATEPPSP
eukprot:gnl/MRDRNA2_/MRDRNA2_103360_c0_seq1.p1 gnl/MRDRNA2_/MRDRNA2_103360_c0~~gnl/MRDRNA2_/MRDRNA2_103360_c0_seq1.p1  ORF type:complete len:437 (+),score=89.81 gnl/MRDRNA2_/MRDRNA2_103360_c0_seq1:90-1400(+)